jgi:4-hydroxy-tetrahydrodipicolinate reductase
VIGAEVMFGLHDQRLTIRHDAGNSARTYAEGAPPANCRTSTFVGMHRGLDRVLDL